MEIVSLGEVAAATGGAIVRGTPDVTLRGVQIDSRRVSRDELFVALLGERFDGHDFVGQALAAGAAAVLVRDARQGELPAGAYGAVTVPDTLEALERLAAWYRVRLAETTVVAVTGSVGKTTTKEMTAALLSRMGRTQKAPASFNNEVGVPLTVLASGRQTRFLVLEVAMRGPGQIRRLASMASPHVAIVTNVGESHVGLLGSLEAVAAAKAEILECVTPGGVAILNADDPRVRAMAERVRPDVRTLFFGSGREADVRIVEVSGGGLGGSAVELAGPAGPISFRLPVPGRHMAVNAAAAVTAALALGLPPSEVAPALGGFTGAHMRMEVLQVPAAGLVVLNDAYNASPRSMEAALETLALAAAERGGRSVAVLGDMLELGDDAPEAHRRLGEQAARHGVAVLIAVGEMAPLVLSGAASHRAGAALVAAQDAEEAIAAAREWVRPGDTVLVKASRAVGLDRVARALAHGGTEGPGSAP